jgi:hypothetical protein
MNPFINRLSAVGTPTPCSLKKLASWAATAEQACLPESGHQAINSVVLSWC